MPIEQAFLYIFMLIPLILFSLTVHEVAHGYIANKFGDPTAKNLGRLTLNPIKHLDLFGTLSMLFLGFGWAKPVPINTRNFKNPRVGMAITGAAGPISNFLLSIVFAVLLKLTLTFLWPVASESLYPTLSALSIFLDFGVFINISLAVFNLLPIPPLDGSRIFYVFLPPRLYFGVMRYERFIMIAVMVLLLLGALSTVIWSITDFLSGGLYSILGIYH